jgi:hypothetical protein
LLHVAPCEVSSFQRYFLQSKVANHLIKNYYVLHISSLFIFVFNGSVKVEVSYKQPVLVLFNVQVVEPINKVLHFLTIIETIYYSEFPLLCIVGCSKLDGDGKFG